MFFQLSVFAAKAKKKMTKRYQGLLSPAEVYETFHNAFEFQPWFGSSGIRRSDSNL